MSSSRNILIAAHIIPETRAGVQLPAWQTALAEAFKDPQGLLSHLQLKPENLADRQLAQRQFSLKVPRHYANLMTKGDPHDPLLRQVLPCREEMVDTPGFIDDPVGDLQAKQQPGLLHKYQGRVLILTTGACGVHCRYCFRRHYPYQNGTATPGQWQSILDTIRRQATIQEVILSGGDPLMINDQRLEKMLAELQALPQLKRLRLHSRLPVVLPQRITPELLELLSSNRLQGVMVLHANHPNEISPELAEACEKMRAAGITLLNQSVLLKGVNDDAETLVRLSERLFEIGVMPYYLHLLDRVSGAGHFEVEPDRIELLKRQLLQQLPGYLVPRMVREIAGEASKTPV
ncbi:MAG: EF-P beta-lysylation protein EpmB [Candidatus Thiodiazotropha weberae]|uniref:EF-P beta-lysylation protein EpmB n=1 Tax=Candidatus Thiodiazotropha endoloripes TaxID=1818881 RepID=UPI0009F5C41F|nr:EF-P beta-lysylation protein EpmB [Candidatus Thiodiazotropha endoloripes]MCG7900556.1 EF-P beta-lysylation protein EpmB [Candidatus Thiodiazotropha weberae]MCG7904677.1 EF-P beta-lysylation protein EpmB [Candidatus Thiodiazotropha weberae]